jgi:peptidoglycan/LPS O-acetylase OafA/YrhL
MRVAPGPSGGGVESAQRVDERTPYPRVFDGYRGLVILCIVLLHLMGTAGWVPRSHFLAAIRMSSFFSIEFLFVVSGFLLFLPVAAKGGFGSVRTYAIKRAARIMPAYVVSLLVTWIVALWIGHPSLPLNDPEVFAVHMVFAQQQFNVSGFGINEVYWYLSLIVIFYALLPLVADRYLRHPLLGLAAALTIVAGWRIILADHLTYLEFIQFPLFVGDFAIGMTGAWLFMRVWRSPARERVPGISARVALVGTVALFTMLYLVGRERLNAEIFFFGEPVWLALAVPATFAVVMGATALAPEWMQWPLSNRVARWVGSVSYGVFLYHVLVLHLTVRALGVTVHDHRTTTVLLLTAVVVPVSLFIGWLSLRFVEQPVVTRARAYARGRGGPSHPVPHGATEPA